MKLPKKVMRYCPYCRKHTEHKISLAGAGGKRGALKRGAVERARLRGLARGFGGYGRWPPTKPPITKWKRKTKTTKKTNLLFTCSVCKKSTMQAKGIRAGKVTLE